MIYCYRIRVHRYVYLLWTIPVRSRDTQQIQSKATGKIPIALMGAGEWG